jgi:hypothetical protein
VYRPYLRRRGPGKAPKGSKSKKRTEGHLPSIDTFNPQIVVPERRRQDTIDTLPPYGDDGPPPYVGMGVRPQAGPGGGRDDDDDEETTDGRAEDGGSER